MKKNINLKSGILVVSLICFFSLSLQPGGDFLNRTDHQMADQNDQTENQNNKPVFEIQFFSNDIRGKLNFDLLEQIGIDKVIVRVFHDKEDNGGLFFSNSVFRVLHPFLDLLIPEFDGKTVKLYAWMITRNFRWVSDREYFDYEYNKGFKKQINRFDIFNPRAVDKIISVFRELASKRITGILIQDDFFIRYNEGFSNWGKAVFSNSTRHPADEKLMMEPSSPYHRLWIATKVSQIIKVLKMIVSACKKQNPDLEIGMNMYYETPYYRSNSETWYAHNLDKIVNSGIDFVYLMTYHRQIKKELNLSEQENQNLFKKIVNLAHQICGNKLVVKIQMRDWNSGEIIPVKELLNYLRLIPQGVQRICLTPVKIEDFGLIRRLLNRYYYPSGVIFKN